MKIYIASPYITQQEINNVIFDKLSEAGYEVFLPKSINIDAITDEEKEFVAQTCYNEIDQCDVMVIVYPFGISVACEAGYAICQRFNGNNRKLILYTNIKSDKIYSEAMFMPYIDYETDNLEELQAYLKILEPSVLSDVVFFA